jgi:hypothetical protein
MRFLRLAAFLAVALLLASATQTNANPIESRGLGCGGVCLGAFAGIHQHGPLFNYGPYYGYYPFKPYGPWDAYLRYDPFFYGDPYANWSAQPQGGAGNMYGWNAGLGGHGGHSGHSHGLHKHGCASCGFSHASWLHGGWFHGNTWLHGGFGHGHKSGCSSCGGVAIAPPAAPGNVLTRYSGIGDPSQSVVFYNATPTLNPVLDIVPVGGLLK